MDSFQNEPNEETLQAMDDTINNRNLLGPFDTVEEAIAALLKDDDEVQDAN